MTSTAEDARRSLAEVSRGADDVRTAMERAVSGPIFFIWGVVWLFGFVGSELIDRFFADAQTRLGLAWAAHGWHWTVLVVMGGIASWVIGRRGSAHVRSAQSELLGRRINWTWWLFYGYIWIAVAVLFPFLDFTNVDATAAMKRIVALGTLIPMLGYAVMGLWLERYFLWAGLIVTALVLFGVFALLPYFWLWMAALGSGTLFATGYRIQRTSRPRAARET